MPRQRSSFPVQHLTLLQSMQPRGALPLLLLGALTTACTTVGSVGPAGGGGSGGGSSTSSGTTPSYEGTCVSLTPAKLGLFSGEKCLAQFYEWPPNPNKPPFEGVFEPVPGGFQIVGATQTLEVLEAEPAIPAGTFVRMTFRCDEPFTFGTASGYVMLENLPELDGVPNPTESGSRLWFYLTAGADFLTGPKGFPFTNETSKSCVSEEDSHYGIDKRTVFDLELSGPDFKVSIPPQQLRSFQVSEGPHAGGYHAENIDIEYHVYSETIHTWYIENYRITRAP